MTQRCLLPAAVQTVAALRFSLCLFAAFIASGVAQAAEPMPASAQASTARTYTVQRGDTLDRVIQQTMTNSPLKIELLRKAFVEANPQAFVSNNVSRLRSGVVLQVPDHTKLLRSTLLPVLEGAEATAATGEGRSPNANANASDRRSWVRFP